MEGERVSKPRYKWWGYVKGMIRDYPALKERYAELHNTSMVADYSGMPRGGCGGRVLESVALRELPSTSQREYEAVRKAVATTERYRNGGDRLKVVRLVLWDRSHTLEGAALQVPCHINTVTLWHTQFIKLVGAYYGLMDE